MDKLDQLLDHYGEAFQRYWNGQWPPSKVTEARDALRAYLQPEERLVVSSLSWARLQQLRGQVESEIASRVLGDPLKPISSI